MHILRSIIREVIEMSGEKHKRISYTGVVLDNKSKSKLFDFLKDMQKTKKIIIPDDWTFSADHITINMGPAIDPSILGQKVLMKVLTYGYDENVIAVGVNLDIDIEFEKENPHITIAYNELNGARPVMSNKLTAWRPVPKAFTISGTVLEVMQEV